ncbi:subclass B3 metallo-beta-lactamase [Lysobacter antibioticus]|uniref:subclass B3 metallo-beta-lactamase n=1 Tax=Lysobacter antibioticus TaxID=84531 RepID=UPI0009E7F6EA|nr:subclass B3 metallo-beta-lactamase [Lysobacter antibioticus]
MSLRDGLLAASLICVLASCASTSTPAPTASAGTAVAPCAADPDWNQPTQPRRIHGNTWYVGTCGLSAVLITSEQGHVLVDGATEKAAPQIEANIRTLGFDPREVRYLLNSHEHNDHAGGLAYLQRVTGATVVARRPAIAALETGKGDRSDPQFLSVSPFPPVTAVRAIGDGETLSLGPIVLTAHATPGHTPGGTSWSWRACDGAGECRAIAYADSLTPFTDDVYRYSDETAHPGVLAAFRRSIETVAALPCDILVTPHPNASNLLARLDAAPGAPQGTSTDCRAYAATGAGKLEDRLAKERASAP